MQGSADYTGMFEWFRHELEDWCRTGKEPRDGNQDVKYYLDLQEKRMKDRGLTMELKLEPVIRPVSAHEITSTSPLFQNTDLSRFNRSSYYQQVNQTLIFRREGKEVFLYENSPTFYETILDADPENAFLGTTTYICPNCGAAARVEQLQTSGCPYCGTRYMMADLYPKVVNFYRIDGAGFSLQKARNAVRNNVKRSLVFAAFITAGALLSIGEFHLFMLFMGAIVFGMAFGMAMLFQQMFLSFCTIGKVLHSAGKSIQVYGGSAGTKKRITEELCIYDPRFDYEYFESKALSLARIVMFHPNLSDCVEYQGAVRENPFQNVIDVHYRGGFKVESVKEIQGNIHVILDLYLNLIWDNGKKIKAGSKNVRLHMFHSVDFPVDDSFTAAQVQCQNCAGSFDARKSRRCPFCGADYDLSVDDWAVLDLR